MLDKLLATKEDFTAFRDISANIKDSKIDIFIRESQLIEVRNFLGPQLYKLLLENSAGILRKKFFVMADN